MNRTCFFLLLCVAFAPFVNVWADKSYYDQQEDIRRTAEKMVEYDRQQREEAKNRADKKEWEMSQIKRYASPGDTEFTPFQQVLGVSVFSLPFVWILWVMVSSLPKTYPPGSTPESIGLAAMKQKERRMRIMRRIEFWKPRSNS